MSELKAHTIYTPMDDVAHDEKGKILEGQEVYLKSEADKVIAELKAQKAQAEDDCAYWKMSEGNAANAMHETEEYAMQLYNELRHSNYKRCLDKAETCKARYDEEDARVNGHYSSWEYISKEMKYWERWKGRWLELADKFKEAK